MISEEERLRDIVEAAEDGLFVGQITDIEALERAIELGLVRKKYEGVSGFLGLAKLEVGPGRH